MSGMRAVEMVIEDLKLSKVLTKQAFENAIVTNGAIGGSTNAVVHLLAIAGRVGVELDLDLAVDGDGEIQESAADVGVEGGPLHAQAGGGFFGAQSHIVHRDSLGDLAA